MNNLTKFAVATKLPAYAAAFAILLGFAAANPASAEYLEGSADLESSPVINLSPVAEHTHGGWVDSHYPDSEIDDHHTNGD